GISSMSANGDWIDVQVVTVGGRESVRVRNYRRSGDRPPESAGLSPELQRRAEQTRGATPLTTDDVVEATSRVSSKAVEAALLETKATFKLDSRALIALDDAGVPDTVIDLMVVLSYA